MLISNLGPLALIQIPNFRLAGAGLYMASILRSRGAILVAASLSLTLVLSIAGNFLPTEMHAVFDESGQIAGAMPNGGSTLPFIFMGYTGTALPLVLALGIAMLAFEWRREIARAVSPESSVEQAREP
jgi:hypothetical protein